MSKDGHTAARHPPTLTGESLQSSDDIACNLLRPVGGLSWLIQRRICSISRSSGQESVELVVCSCVQNVVLGEIDRRLDRSSCLWSSGRWRALLLK